MFFTYFHESNTATRIKSFAFLQEVEGCHGSREAGTNDDQIVTLERSHFGIDELDWIENKSCEVVLIVSIMSKF